MWAMRANDGWTLVHGMTHGMEGGECVKNPLAMFPRYVHAEASGSRVEASGRGFTPAWGHHHHHHLAFPRSSGSFERGVGRISARGHPRISWHGGSHASTRRRRVFRARRGEVQMRFRVQCAHGSSGAPRSSIGGTVRNLFGRYSGTNSTARSACIWNDTGTICWSIFRGRGSMFRMGPWEPVLLPEGRGRARGSRTDRSA